MQTDREKPMRGSIGELKKDWQLPKRIETIQQRIRQLKRRLAINGGSLE